VTTTSAAAAAKTGRGPFAGLPREAAVLSAVSFTVALGYGIVAPGIPAFARQFGVGVAAAASVISAFALMRVAFALPAGRLADRFGPRRVMAAGIAVVAVSSMLAGFSRSFAELLVCAVRAGDQAATTPPSAGPVIPPGRNPPVYRPLARPRWPLGTLASSSAWALTENMAEPSAARAFLPVRRAARGAGGDRYGRARAAGARATASPRESLTVLAGALRNRAYQAVAAVNLADGFAVLGIRGAIIPLFVRDSLHRSATWAGIGFLVFAALNAAALLPAGRAADTLGRRPVMVAGCAISAAGLLLLAVLPGLRAYLGALAVAGAGSGLLDVAPSAMLGDLLSAQARQGGILVAFFQMAGDAGTVTGPVVAGLLVDSASYPAAFGLAGGVLAAAGLLALITPEPHSNRGTSP
jgi:MFS family permease